MTDGKYLKCFWKSIGVFNTTSSGLDSHSLRSWNEKEPEFSEWLYAVRKDLKPYVKIKCVPLCKGYSEEFRNIVDNAVKCVKDNKCAWLYTLEQVEEFLRFMPETIVYKNGDVYVAKPDYKR